MQISSSIADTHSCAHVLPVGVEATEVDGGGRGSRSRFVQLKAVKGHVGATSVRRNRNHVKIF